MAKAAPTVALCTRDVLDPISALEKDLLEHYERLAPLLSAPASVEHSRELVARAGGLRQACAGCLVAVLLTPARARPLFDHVKALGARGLGALSELVKESTMVLFETFADQVRSQMLWVFNELIISGPQQHAAAQSAITGVLRFISTGDTSTRSTNLVARLLGLLSHQRSWVVAQRSLPALLLHRLTVLADDLRTRNPKLSAQAASLAAAVVASAPDSSARAGREAILPLLVAEPGDATVEPIVAALVGAGSTALTASASKAEAESPTAASAGRAAKSGLLALLHGRSQRKCVLACLPPPLESAVVFVLSKVPRAQCSGYAGWIADDLLSGCARPGSR